MNKTIKTSETNGDGKAIHFLKLKVQNKVCVGIFSRVSLVFTKRFLCS